MGNTCVFTECASEPVYGVKYGRWSVEVCGAHLAWGIGATLHDEVGPSAKVRRLGAVPEPFTREHPRPTTLLPERVQPTYTTRK